ncbi:hypothetical protein HPB49_013433 [Dermacentor silvarum]|uniref:Uncharacterized protein n=1 Tax=Dermacentor silvarum TaxID=543639 RepID=A0ACB8CLC3_DERSI|nr:hypothetical protein HPB49_013433 [Dermacentor silvarum]
MTNQDNQDIEASCPPLLSKSWYKTPRLLTKENYIYVCDEITEDKKKPNIDIILTQFVEGLGNKWDIVSVRPFYGLLKLIVPGLALYATPENLKLREKMRVGMEDLGPVFSTRTSPVGITVPEEAIELPETPITGPDYAGKENKVFLATIYVNKVDKGMIPSGSNMSARLSEWMKVQRCHSRNYRSKLSFQSRRQHLKSSSQQNSSHNSQKPVLFKLHALVKSTSWRQMAFPFYF